MLQRNNPKLWQVIDAIAASPSFDELDSYVEQLRRIARNYRDTTRRDIGIEVVKALTGYVSLDQQDRMFADWIADQIGHAYISRRRQ